MKQTTKSIPIQVISQHRTELMAVGIILIMICHSTLRFDAQIKQVYSVICQFCQIGVDMFLFLSGVGIYYSLSKSDDIGKFYRKRIARLLPPYIIVLIIWGIAQIFHNTTGGVIGFIYAYSLITFFLRGELSEWYIAAIIPLYLLSPWFIKCIDRKRKGLQLLIMAVYLLSVVILLCANCFLETKYGRAITIVNEIWIVRIPIFLVGMYFGKILRQGTLNCISMKKAGIVLILGVALFVLNTVVFPGKKLWFSQWYISRTIFGIICIPLVLFVGYMFNLTSRNNILIRILGYVGTITLELYLLHVKVQSYLDSLLPKTLLASVLTNILAVLLSLLLALLVNKTDKKIQQLFIKRKQLHEDNRGK